MNPLKTIPLGMSNFQIKEPWWKEHAVGLAERDMLEDRLTVEILHERKDGTRTFPGKYWIPKDVALKYPVDWRKGVKLHVVPITSLKEVSDD